MAVRAASACSAFLIALSCPAFILAQSSGTIVGVVVDDLSGEALPQATLSARGVEVHAVTDPRGFFELTPLAPGKIAVRVELHGYVALMEQVEVLPGEVALFQFRLSRMDVAVQGLLARARARDDVGSAVSRVERGKAESFQTALDLLRQQIPGVIVRGRHGEGPGIRIRGASSLSSNDPALYVDGVLMADGVGGNAVTVLEQIPAESVQSVRVLHGPSAAARFGDANSGVILVETR